MDHANLRNAASYRAPDAASALSVALLRVDALLSRARTDDEQRELLTLVELIWEDSPKNQAASQWHTEVRQVSGAPLHESDRPHR